MHSYFALRASASLLRTWLNLAITSFSGPSVIFSFLSSPLLYNYMEHFPPPFKWTVIIIHIPYMPYSQNSLKLKTHCQNHLLNCSEKTEPHLYTILQRNVREKKVPRTVGNAGHLHGLSLLPVPVIHFFSSAVVPSEQTDKITVTSSLSVLEKGKFSI